MSEKGRMNAKMFDLLWDEGADASIFEDQAARFEIIDGEWPTASQLLWMYWFGENSAAAVMGRSWLLNEGYEVTLLWDMATHPNGDHLGYVVVTDYDHRISGDDDE